MFIIALWVLLNSTILVKDKMTEFKLKNVNAYNHYISDITNIKFGHVMIVLKKIIIIILSFAFDNIFHCLCCFQIKKNPHNYHNLQIFYQYCVYLRLHKTLINTYCMPIVVLIKIILIVRWLRNVVKTHKILPPTSFSESGSKQAPEWSRSGLRPRPPPRPQSIQCLIQL